MASARALMSTTTVGVRTSARSKQLLWALTNLLWKDVAIISIKCKQLGNLMIFEGVAEVPVFVDSSQGELLWLLLFFFVFQLFTTPLLRVYL